MQNATTSTAEETINETVQVPISRGYFVTIDREDYERVTQFKWTALPTRWTVYARRNVKGTNGKQHSLYLHRFLMGDPEGLEVDHKDGNGLDNRKANLRIANKSQQACNTKKQKRNKSGFKGVGWAKRNQKWQAYIGIDRKFIHLGYFNSKEEAAAARKSAAILLHKDFHRIE